MESLLEVPELQEKSKTPIGAINEDFQKFQKMSDEDKCRHPQYVLYLSFIKMGKTSI